MNYANIKPLDVANGSGIRVSLFVSGCRNHCEDCFNPESWDFHYGTIFDAAAEERILQSLRPDYVRGLTLLGGEPLEPENQPALYALLQKVRREYPQKDIWCYTGFVYEALPRSRAVESGILEELLSLIDVLVEGPFVRELKDLSLRFRGSKNQRILDLPASRKAGMAVLWTDEYGGQSK